MIQHRHRLSSLRICHARPGQGALFTCESCLPGKFYNLIKTTNLTKIPTYEMKVFKTTPCEFFMLKVGSTFKGSDLFVILENKHLRDIF